MAVPEWLVIVVRAWRDSDGVRVRILSGDADTHRSAAVTATAVEAGAIVQQLVAELELAGDDDVTVSPPHPDEW